MKKKRDLWHTQAKIADDDFPEMMEGPKKSKKM